VRTAQNPKQISLILQRLIRISYAEGPISRGPTAM
jgi:hypothetical protein